MRDIAKNDGAAVRNAAAAHLGALAEWEVPDPQSAVVHAVHAQIAARSAHAARTVVLVPYAPLASELQATWARTHPHGFVPRFDTPSGWARSLPAGPPEAEELTFDVAHDLLVAGHLIERAGVTHLLAEHALTLVQAAHQCGRRIAAIAPEARAAWGVQARSDAVDGLDGAVLAVESVMTWVALEWALSSRYSTDPLFAQVQGDQLDLLIALHGVHEEPVAAALVAACGTRGICMPIASGAALDAPVGKAPQVALHGALGAEDEAMRAAACVVRHLALGRAPVALVATDRLLARRVRAMLDARGVTVRDDSGWRLSTTRAAAQVDAALGACARDASPDAVLDWLKHVPIFDAAALRALEQSVRRDAPRDWAAWQPAPARATDANDVPALRERIDRLRALLAGRRTLTQWLQSLRTLLQATEQWAQLVGDAAGDAVIATLRLDPVVHAEWAARISAVAWAERRIDAAEATRWMHQALEAVTFVPLHQPRPQVVILPMSQLLGRRFAAVVMPGCDAQRLPVSPELPGHWTPVQRERLGFATRAQMQTEARGVWAMALRAAPLCDVIWRSCEDGGEALSASPLVQALQLGPADADAPLDVVAGVDPLMLRAIAPQPVLPPQPRAPALVPLRLSASAYEDLRRCPYRFFALRMLGLQESDELGTEIGKRDFGLWLHAVLAGFHLALQAAPTDDPSEQGAMLDTAAEQARHAQGLSGAEFLPFAAVWPHVRGGYIDWLATHAGVAQFTFAAAEQWLEQPLGAVTLVGQVDRTDRHADGSTLVIDYKTEALIKSKARINDPTEDTQLAFYAALLPDDTLRAAYVNVGERSGTCTVELPDVVAVRDLLVEGIADDLARIAAGSPLPALGEGAVCDFCAARGLCRKDEWQPGASPLPAEAFV